jgi:hypothetical protein
MGKRSEFERNPRDFYPTPYDAVLPLLKHLPKNVSFIEPCAGDGRLIRHLEKHGHKCIYACDIEPQAEGIEKADVLFFGHKLPLCDLIVTNPPWEREVLHQMINVFSDHCLTWILFDSDWMFTGQAVPYLKFCKKIVAVGRVSWMENGKAGMENACWYCFDKGEAQTIFVA